jgi:hypothetical protein
MTSRSGKLASALAVAAALSSTDGAYAAEPLALTWQAPRECPQRAAVRARIDALVPAAATSKERLEADGKIERVGRRFRLKLRMRVGEVSGERQIESDSCQDLAGAAAVALGLMLQSAEPALETQPDSTGSSSATTAPTADAGDAATPAAAPTAARPAPSAAPDSAEEESPPPEGDSVPARDRGWAVLLHAPLLAFDLGPLPNASFGGALGGGVLLGRWRFALDFQLGPSQSVSVSGEPRLSADVSRMGLEAWLCRGFRAEPFELSPCLSVGWERITAEGTGAGVEARSTQASFVSAGAGVFGHLYVSDFLALMLGLGGKVEGARPHVLVEGVGEVEQLKPAAFWVKAGPEWIF